MHQPLQYILTSGHITELSATVWSKVYGKKYPFIVDFPIENGDFP
jgi:hypothetical protein